LKSSLSPRFQIEERGKDGKRIHTEPGERNKSLEDVGSRFGAGFQVAGLELPGQANGVILRHAGDPVALSGRSEVGFGPAQDQRDAGLVAVADTLHPVTDIEERLLAGDVEEQHDSVGLAEVGSSQGAEALLPCFIPHTHTRADCN